MSLLTSITFLVSESTAIGKFDKGSGLPIPETARPFLKWGGRRGGRRGSLDRSGVKGGGGSLKQKLSLLINYASR